MEHLAVYKYTKPVLDVVTLELPPKAKLLSVADQEGMGRRLDFWALVDLLDLSPKRERAVRILPTGAVTEMPALDGFDHFDTVVTAGGALVWHVFLDFDGAREIPEGQ